MRSILLLALCAMFAAHNGLAAEPAVKIVRDIPFLGANRAEKLDLYLPATPPAAGRRTPGFVWIHGGGWTGGDKAEARGTEVCTTLAQAGYVAISVNYKLGDHSWPTNVLDSKNAVRWLRAHAAEYQVDPDRIGVGGGSAGGHLALMVGFTTGKKELEPEDLHPGVSSAVRCIVNMYGITDLITTGQVDAAGQPTATRVLMEKSLTAFSAASTSDPVLRLASPLTHATKSVPPVLTFHGRADTIVDYPQSEKLDAALKALGATYETVYLDGVGHSFDWERSGANPLPRDLRPTALAFLAKHLGAPVR